MTPIIKFPKVEFEKIRVVLQTIPDITMGGCGVSALAMYRWLETRGYNMNNVKFAIGYSSDSSTYSTNFNSYLFEDALTSACTHMGIIIQDSEHDITLDQNRRWYFDDYKHVQVVGVEYIMGAINGTSWNEDFNRGECIPMIERALGIDLSDVITEGHLNN